MSTGLLVLLLIIAGAFFAFKLRGASLRRALKYYAAGGAMLMLGAVGSLAALGGETSGNTNMFNVANPYIWPAIFVGGVLILAVNSVMIIRDWRAIRPGLNASSRQPVPESPRAAGTVQGDDDGPRGKS